MKAKLEYEVELKRTRKFPHSNRPELFNQLKVWGFLHADAQKQHLFINAGEKRIKFILKDYTTITPVRVKYKKSFRRVKEKLYRLPIRRNIIIDIVDNQVTFRFKDVTFRSVRDCRGHKISDFMRKDNHIIDYSIEGLYGKYVKILDADTSKREVIESIKQDNEEIFKEIMENLKGADNE